MRALLILAFVVAAAQAQTGPWCAAATDSDPSYDSSLFAEATTTCAASDGIPCDMPTMIDAAGTSVTYMNKYRWCAPTGSSMESCCPDECAVRKQSACTTSHGTSNPCMFVQGPGVTLLCMVKDKVCGLLSNATLCDMYSFCKFESGSCNFAEPTIPEGAAGDSVADKCPALHPVVIAMLALMFITFVGAVVLVAVVVYRNQKTFDDEEERRAQIEAASAEAKRSRNNRNTL